jgi:hypothetical protein
MSFWLLVVVGIVVVVVVVVAEDKKGAGTRDVPWLFYAKKPLSSPEQVSVSCYSPPRAFPFPRATLRKTSSRFFS